MNIMDQVNNCLKCITDPGLVRDKGILKTLSEYDQKLREIEVLQFEMLKKILVALKCANILYYSIGNEHGKENSTQEYLCDSLMDELGQLLNNFGNCRPCDDSASNSLLLPLSCKKQGESSSDDKNEKYDLLPVPVFPLCRDKYYTDTQKQHENAKKEKEAAKEYLDIARENKEAAQACFESLDTAIQKSKNAKSGK